MIPSCAQHVYITLQRKDYNSSKTTNSNNNNNNEPPSPLDCKGLLIRDDIILTTKLCSQYKYTFDFVGLKEPLMAIPHSILNKQLATAITNNKGGGQGFPESELGFLKANPPYHYIYVDRPVRRARMFLSQVSHSHDSSRHHGKDLFLSCHDDKPIAHSFPSSNNNDHHINNDNNNHKFVKFIPFTQQLRNILPSDILWDNSDIDTAVTLSYANYKWYAKPIKLPVVEYDISKYIHKLTGPSGAVSLPNMAGKHFIDKASEIMEVIDSRGHRRDCWPYYYETWRDERPFSKMYFMDWLDFGPGKYMDGENSMHDDEVCYKEHFNKHRVHYFNDDERSEWEVVFTPSNDGTQLIGRYKHTNEVVPESVDFEGRYDEDAHHYMFSLNRTWYIVADELWNEDEYGTIKHTGIMAGQPALAGGEIYFMDNGVVWGVDSESGHYKPDLHNLVMIYYWMKVQMKFPVDSIKWLGRKEGHGGHKPWSPLMCSKIRWETKVQISGFDSKGLERSCYDMMRSPGWMLVEDV